MAKTKSDINLLNKSHEMINEFSYSSNTNLNGFFFIYLERKKNMNFIFIYLEIEELNHKKPNESQIGRLKYVEPNLDNRFVSPQTKEVKLTNNHFVDKQEEELWLLRNELQESKTYINLLREEIGKLNRQNDEMHQKM